MDFKEVVCVYLLLCGLVEISHAAYNNDYMIENCTSAGDGFTRDLFASPSTYGFVRPVRQGGYPKGMDCTLTIVAPPFHYLVVKFRRLEIYQKSKKCTDADYLTISGNTSSYIYCGYRTPSHSLISTGDTIKVRFVTNSVIDNNARKGFEIYYTAFHKGECNTGGDFATEFRCRSGNRCIPSELRCDYYDNCGDWSDERAKTCGLSKAMTVCVSIVAVFVGCTCGIGIFMCICAKKKERSARARRSEQVVQVEYSRDPAHPAAAPVPLGEKPPLPEYDNYAFSGVHTLDPEQFLPPPAYETINPAATEGANTVGTDPTNPFRNQVAPLQNSTPQSNLPPSERNQVAPLPPYTKESNRTLTTTTQDASENVQGRQRDDDYEDVALGNDETAPPVSHEIDLSATK